MKKTFLLFVFALIGALLFSTEVDAQRNKFKRRSQKRKKISNYKGAKKRRGGGFGRFRPYMWAAAGINAGNYFGDLAPVNRAASTDISFTRPGFGGTFGYRMNPYMSARASLNWIRVSGSDFSADPSDSEAVLRYQRNLSFRNDILELIGGAEIDLFPNNGGANSRVTFTPYLFLGGGVYLHGPRGKVPEFNTFSPDYNPTDPNSSPASARFSDAGKWVNLKDLGTEGQNLAGGSSYSSFGISIPVAVGFKLRLPDQFDAAIEFGYRHIFTDYIDDVSSGSYVDPTLFTDDLARAMADRSLEHVDVLSESARNPIPTRSYSDSREIRGNPEENDKIFVTTIRISYILNAVSRKAKFR